MVGTQCKRARGVSRECIRQHGTHLFGLYLLFESHHIVTSTSEINASTQSTSYKTTDEHNQHHSHKHKCFFVNAHEGEVNILHEVLREACGEGEFRPTILVQLIFVNQTSEEHSGEERTNDTDDKRCCEASDGTCTERIKDDTRDD